MAIVELVMPRMGESIIEATIISWNKKVGDPVEEDETVLEVATDKVDSEVTSPVAGVITKILFEKDSVVPVGGTLALIQTDGESSEVQLDSKESTNPDTESSDTSESSMSISETEMDSDDNDEIIEVKVSDIADVSHTVAEAKVIPESDEKSELSERRFYSPLIRTIAKSENISLYELDTIKGTGPNGRVIKEDLFAFVNQRRIDQNAAIDHPKVNKAKSTANPLAESISKSDTDAQATSNLKSSSSSYNKNGDELIEMDRMRKMIAQHMVRSKQESPHVTSVVEADVTPMVMWRNKVKDRYAEKYGEKITYSHLFTECVVKALRDYPMINGSIDGDHIVVKKNINIGIATALESGNLIVPVIKQCEELNLLGITKRLNDLTSRARSNKLKPDEIQGGTFTISNIGTFDNLIGTPIIYQPQLAILALGAIKKKPVIQETDQGDIIAIRHMMYLSLSYDHRVVDGYLGGSFLKRIAEYIEKFNPDREI